MKKISVCMATYNGERYLRAQLESILTQLGEDDEIVVQDDCSTDATLSMLEAFRDPRIQVVRNPRNLGVMCTIEKALARARGAYIFLSDQDDVWLPGRVESALTLLGKYDLVVVNCRVVDEQLQTISEDFFALLGSRPGFLRNLYRNTFLGCCMSFRRGLLERVLPFPHPIPMHDMWIGMVATVWGAVYFHPEPLILYRRHDATVTSTATNRAARPARTKLLDRIRLVSGIVGRMFYFRAFRAE